MWGQTLFKIFNQKYNNCNQITQLQNQEQQQELKEFDYRTVREDSFSCHRGDSRSARQGEKKSAISNVSLSTWVRRCDTHKGVKEVRVREPSHSHTHQGQLCAPNGADSSANHLHPTDTGDIQLTGAEGPPAEQVYRQVGKCHEEMSVDTRLVKNPKMCWKFS